MKITIDIKKNNNLVVLSVYIAYFNICCQKKKTSVISLKETCFCKTYYTYSNIFTYNLYLSI